VGFARLSKNERRALSGHRATIIGAGLGGLGLACLLAKSGYQVTVVEKNRTLGGRARQFSEDGFTFDMGPSWYLMPDVFEAFFRLLNERVEDHLQLVKLSPSYRIYAEDDQTIDLPSDPAKAMALFESIEPGAGAQLEKYLNASRYQYDVVMQHFMHRNFDTPLDFLSWRLLLAGTKLSAFSTMSRYVSRFFKTPILQKIMQYQLLFLGSSPFKTPSIYNVMGHIDFNMGVYYPMGGIYQLVATLAGIARKHGAVIRTDAPANAIRVRGGKADGVELDDGDVLDADLVISNADIHHTETQLLSDDLRDYPSRYWESRQLAPSALILYLGLNDRPNSLLHHNVIFNDNWEASFAELFDSSHWPAHPSYYVCCPSQTDPSLAPDGKSAVFMLMPVSATVSYDECKIEAMADRMLGKADVRLGLSGLKDRIAFKRAYSGADFARDYNSLGGSALGLAHTLKQTALLRPNNRSRKVANLYYVGAGTNPGIGMPICLISAQLAYKRIMRIKSAKPLETLED
jgi:phytoene desaturase